jgi:hypothetical protein
MWLQCIIHGPLNLPYFKYKLCLLHIVSIWFMIQLVSGVMAGTVVRLHAGQDVSEAFDAGLVSAFRGPDILPANGTLITQVCSLFVTAGPHVCDHPASCVTAANVCTQQHTALLQVETCRPRHMLHASMFKMPSVQ